MVCVDLGTFTLETAEKPQPPRKVLMNGAGSPSHHQNCRDLVSKRKMRMLSDQGRSATNTYAPFFFFEPIKRPTDVLVASSLD